MTENKNVKNNKTRYNMRSALVSYYLFIMFTFFEVFLTNQYAHARNDKYTLFIILTVTLTVSVIVVSIIYAMDKDSETKVVENVPVFSFSFTDIAMIAFVVFAAVSTAVSKYRLDSITGNAGRNNGLLLLALYLCAYFIISRFYYFKEYVLVGFLVFGCFISGLAVLNYFYIDPLGLLKGYGEDVIADFGTTIGNKNTIASYMCLFLPASVMMFVHFKKRYIRILSLVSIAFSYMGLLVADSNSGYIGLFAVVFFMLLLCTRDKDKLKIYFLAMTIMFASGKLLRLFSYIMDDKSKGFEKIADFLIYDNRSYFIILAFFVLYLLMCYVNDKISVWHKNTVSGIVCILGAVVLSVFSYLFIKYTFFDTKTDIGGLAQMFRFNDRWATHRGFMWINGVKEYAKFDFIHLMFGSGCDTFYHVFEPYFGELAERFNNSSTDCIHSEYLNYLVTQGALGLASYLAVIISTVYKAVKNSSEKTLGVIFVCPVVCYCVQAIVNIYQPITTPFLFIFIALCECISRNSNPANNIKATI